MDFCAIQFENVFNSIFFCQVQAIVDHHHASDNARTATKVRFTEPHDTLNEDEDEGSLEKVYSGICPQYIFFEIDNVT